MRRDVSVAAASIVVAATAFAAIVIATTNCGFSTAAGAADELGSNLKRDGDVDWVRRRIVQRRRKAIGVSNWNCIGDSKCQPRCD